MSKVKSFCLSKLSMIFIERRKATINIEHYPFFHNILDIINVELMDKSVNQFYIM